MDGREFFDQVAGHEELRWVGVREGLDPSDDEVYVGCVTTGAKFALPLTEISSHEWDELKALLTEKRRPRILTHLTRIVGYFSKVHNWNRSKHAELKDRHSGTYVLPEESPVRRKPVVAA